MRIALTIMLLLLVATPSFARILAPTSSPKVWDLSEPYNRSTYLPMLNNAATGAASNPPVRLYGPSTSTLINVGAAGLGRKMIGTVGKAVPYVNLALLGYSAYTELQAAFDKKAAENKVDYPKLYEAMYGPGANNLSPESQVGEKVLGCGYMEITRRTVENASYAHSPGYDCGSRAYYYSDANGDGQTDTRIVWDFVPIAQPEDRPLLAAQVQDNFNGPSLGPNMEGPLDPAIFEDLERFATANPEPFVTTLSPEVEASIQKLLYDAEAAAARQKQLDEAQAVFDDFTHKASELRAQATAARAAADADPLNPALQEAAKAAEAAATAAEKDANLQRQVVTNISTQIDQQAAQDTSTDTAIPEDRTDNVYDVVFETPDKKDIKALVKGFIDNSPLAAIVKSFKVQTSDTACSFTTHVQTTNSDLVFDFCRYQSSLAAAGGIFLGIIYGYAIFVIFRTNY